MSDEQKIYEIGYLISPYVPEDEVVKVVEEVRAAVEKSGGLIKEEGTPSMRNLTYPVVQALHSKRNRFVSAYFSYVKFIAPASSTAQVKSALGANQTIIRFLLIHLFKDIAPRPVRRMITPRPAPADKGPLDEAKIDQEIEQLIAQEVTA